MNFFENSFVIQYANFLKIKNDIYYLKNKNFFNRTNTFLQPQQLCFTKIQSLAKTQNHCISHFMFTNTKNCRFCIKCLTYDITSHTIKYQNYTNPRVSWACSAYLLDPINGEIPEKVKI